MVNLISKLIHKFNNNYPAKEEKFPPAVLERLESDDDNLIVARATPSTNRLSRWIIIYKRRSNDIRDQYFKLRYTIHEFELPNSISDPAVSEKVNKKTWYVRKEDEIYDLLKHIGINPGSFSPPSRSNYPFTLT